MSLMILSCFSCRSESSMRPFAYHWQASHTALSGLAHAGPNWLSKTVEKLLGNVQNTGNMWERYVYSHVSQPNHSWASKNSVALAKDVPCYWLFLVKRKLSLRAGHNTAILRGRMAQQHSWYLTLRKSRFPKVFRLLAATNILGQWAKTKCQSCLLNELYVCLQWQGRYKRKSGCFMQNKMMSNGKKAFKLKELKRHNIGELHNLVKYSFKSQITVAQCHSVATSSMNNISFICTVQFIEVF